MFYKMIQKKRDAWFSSPSCTVANLILYILQTNKMRDAQVEAIKTYLFLKIGCDNKPLHILFSEGTFNNIDLSEIELKSHTKDFLEQHPAAVAMFEYASLKDEEGNLLAPKVVDAIRRDPASLDYISFFKKTFYDVSYTDYLFSLPMGAGKTYLMAAFIYIDLYFAQNEPENQAFAHNFIIFAPSGLKTSVVPSLRTIQNFDPAWIIPEPAASNLKRKLKFEVLDQNKTASKSNKTKNPNVQKIAIHQPLEELFGFVAVTNAEKVILDRIQEKDGQITMFEESDDEKDRQANELRNLIGKLPQLSIFIDEVHHAATDDKKLRAVVSKWMQNKAVNSVIGFSGTPYLQKTEKLAVADKLTLSSIKISNIVYYYPLINGIGNFLKTPTVKISNNKNRLEIVESGIREFLSHYRDKVYPDGTCAKLGIYCGGGIGVLEEEVYPLAERIVAEYGLNPTEAVLKFHGGNKQYPVPIDSELQFASLDKAFSTVRIVLLVQIGKEGWDCRSLTGIILSQEGDCPTNMVLQTTCRCLRQVQKGMPETALIYLNESNAEILNMQLQQQHHISIKEFESGLNKDSVTLKRYDRTAYLKLPKIEFYQLKVNYTTLIVDKDTHITEDISSAPDCAKENSIVREAQFAKELETVVIDPQFHERGRQIADFHRWLYEIVRQSFGFITLEQLQQQNDALKKVFAAVTYENEGQLLFSSRYDVGRLNAEIRKAFYEKRSFETIEELIPEHASLLKVENLTPEISTTHPEDYYPDTGMVEKIMLDDKGKLKLDAKMEQAIQLLLDAGGNEQMVNQLREKGASHPMKNKSFHYLPYKTDSDFEQRFLCEVLRLSSVREMGLEVYYNGDRALTEFKIKCYKQKGKQWVYIGMYTPDFLIVQRRNDEIYKAAIVETKGKIYANDPTFQDKKLFMERAFKAKNNEAFGYGRFEYLFLEDTLDEDTRILTTHDTIRAFFEEDTKNGD